MIIQNETLVKVSEEDITNGKFIVPSSVKIIAEDAFSRLNNLQFVEIPEGVTEIGDNAFYHCENLESINIPSTTKSLGSDVFSHCEKLSKITISDGLESIGERAFDSCQSLTSISLPDTVKLLGNNAFYQCRLLKNAKLSNSLSEIYHNTFNNCINLENIDIPKNVTKIGAGAFSCCYALKSVTCPEGLTTIGRNAFEECHDLESINFPSTLGILEEFAFNLCTSLTSVKLPDSIHILPKSVFSRCLSLSEVSMPKNLQSIGEYAFDECSSLKSINLPHTLIEAKNNAFRKCSSLSEVTIPSSLKTIPANMFSYCTGLKNVTIENGVNYIEQSAFANCKNLEEISIGDSVSFLGEHNFLGCSALKKFKMPKGITHLRSGTFQGCSSLEDIDLGNITIIGSDAFHSCTNLKKLSIPEAVTKIERAAFQYSGLEDITIGKNVESIGESTFYNCRELKKVSLLNSLLTLPNEIFNSCPELAEVHLPQRLKTIGNKAFMNCSSLKSLDLPSSLESINEEAFSYCQELQDLKLPNSLNSIGFAAFENCLNLASLEIPSSVRKLDDLRNSYMFFDKRKDGFALLKEQSETAIPTETIKINLPLLSLNWDNRSLLFSEQKNPAILEVYNNFLETLDPQKQKEFANSHNFTFFKQLKIDTNSEKSRFNIYKALYNLGALSSPIEINGKTINYAQKVVGFLLDKISKEEIDLKTFDSIFKDMSISGLKPEFTDFFLSNFSGLMAEEKNNSGFISKCYNDFEIVQKTNTANHGSQRQLKPTLQKFQNYFLENKFSGVTPATLGIAKSISPYFDQQDDFDTAISMFDEKSEHHVPDYITGEPLSEQELFSGIDSYAEAIQKAEEQTTYLLTEVAESQFSFEWLSKNDPDNLILGKLCNCCAHLKGAGYGIVHASISHPDVQTLVFRDKNGIIVAKSTLFVNRKEGYAIFNNVEMNASLLNSEKNIIYQKFMIATEEFVKSYNKNNPDHPIRQVNIGLNRNKLKQYFEKYNKPTPNILTPINYSEYGTDDYHYNGDSDKSQAIVWQEEEKEK